MQRKVAAKVADLLYYQFGRADNEGMTETDPADDVGGAIDADMTEMRDMLHRLVWDWGLDVDVNAELARVYFRNRQSGES